MLSIRLLFPLLAISVLLAACGRSDLREPMNVFSPDGELEALFLVTEEGTPAYALKYRGVTLIDTARLGFEFQGIPDFKTRLVVKGLDRSTGSQTWTRPWADQASAKASFHQLRIEVQERDAPNRYALLFLRAYDGGMAWRWSFPLQTDMTEVTLLEERTAIRLPADAAWIGRPAGQDSAGYQPMQEPGALLTTPAYARIQEDDYLAIWEMDLEAYPPMRLRLGEEASQVRVDLEPDTAGYKHQTASPWETPWRVFDILDDLPPETQAAPITESPSS